MTNPVALEMWKKPQDRTWDQLELQVSSSVRSCGWSALRYVQGRVEICVWDQIYWCRPW